MRMKRERRSDKRSWGIERVQKQMRARIPDGRAKAKGEKNQRGHERWNRRNRVETEVKIHEIARVWDGN